ncbi:hypothetical protein DQ244_02330 [Blastococcus sp. TBT05-19]|uniref:hypothetical protein n=1 Tax=Blastococcus sp. TBT05-19 TaxID=2250581 RepID=UPI000DE82918|nr:hypothetical protein [Blastococcus sp. TBT05-19]RBY94208.1 hypothetical protein DQ244_02330 [Blastococcus sp. TBT05-19]
MTSFTTRLALPRGWYELERDDPDAWIARLLDHELRDADEAERQAVADELVDLTYLDDVTGSVETLVHLDPEAPRVRALLLTYPTRRRSWLRRGPAAFASSSRRAMARTGAPVEETRTRLTGAPAVRLRGTARDELDRLTEQVLHVVVPPGAPGAVVLRVQWPAGRPDAAELAATADAIARDALVEVW